MDIELPHTPRLRFRRVRPDDAERFDALDRDQDVLRFIDWKPPTLDEQRAAVAGYLGEYRRWPQHGRFVAESPQQEFVGWFGLRIPDDVLVPDLGYRLHHHCWGQGLATEGSRALIDHAFTRLAARAVQADTMWAATSKR